jgi:hypothetical protein
MRKRRDRGVKPYDLSRRLPSEEPLRGLPATYPHQSRLRELADRRGLQLVSLPPKRLFRPFVCRGLPVGAGRDGGSRPPSGVRRQGLRRRQGVGRSTLLLQGSDERTARVPVVLPLGESGASAEGLRRDLTPGGGRDHGGDVRIVFLGTLRHKGSGDDRKRRLPAARRGPASRRRSRRSGSWSSSWSSRRWPPVCWRSPSAT